MNVLVADDEPVSRQLLETTLSRWGHRVVTVDNGADALEQMRSEHGPTVAILDWMMPGMDGPEVCRRLRATAVPRAMYLILLTSRSASHDRAAGLDAGADDYLAKPFDPVELRARLGVADRVTSLDSLLRERVSELVAALAKVKRLQGLLPICCYCKRIRDDRDYWHRVECYLEEHSEARFSHAVCPGCYRDELEPQIEGLAPS